MSAISIAAGHFVIEYSEQTQHDNGRTWMANRQVGVLCETVEQALVILREHAPEAIVHVVRRVGTRTPLLVDSSLLAENRETE